MRYLRNSLFCEAIIDIVPTLQDALVATYLLAGRGRAGCSKVITIRLAINYIAM